MHCAVAKKHPWVGSASQVGMRSGKSISYSKDLARFIHCTRHISALPRTESLGIKNAMLFPVSRDIKLRYFALSRGHSDKLAAKGRCF
jgi:hypothetical protein